MHTRVGSSVLWVLGTVGVFSGCVLDEREDDEAPQQESLTAVTLSGASDSDADTDEIDDDDGSSGGVKLDLGDQQGSGGIDCQEGVDCPTDCELSEHTACDDGTTDVFAAMGLGCPGEVTVQTSVMGSLQSVGVRTGFGPTDTWAPREGSSFAVIGSGFVADLDLATPDFDNDALPTHCNDTLGEFDPGATLPAPIILTDVAGDCTTDEALLGTGDCSNTVQAQFDQGGMAYDYAEIRVVAEVPPSNNSISYDFAFFSTEYPFYFGQQFNDMYIGWLESESWTGNISFDEQGQPISLNAGFLDFRDDGGNLVPEFDGTCMQQHAGTKWLSSTAPVTPGETITVVLAIFDLADGQLDSYAFIDNFNWGCEGTDTPTTKPVG